ncbi:TetR/AcrR family transcriptional regulator [uncultured Alistipes sp.]|jgi:regulatory protein|uniref:TetR/AcrR family transcriptional regulator n=1 Tax=uncultured Alistipes sp. TaxID=538949 RepID=UPI0025E4508A|nr:TetR/AcrR family transcriptional regulator [uncultured Alistipes sp.]
MSEPAKNKEQAILKAAEQEFLLKGFDGARTTTIAAAAGVTHAMLHYYFRTKENIFERVLEEKLHMMGDSVLQAFGAEDLPLLERIREGMSRHFDFITANPNLPRFLVNEITMKPERYDMIRQKVKPIVSMLAGSVQRELNELADRGEVEYINARHMMLDILSLNVFPILAYPIIKPLIEGDVTDYDDFIAQRKQENIEIIMRRIKKIK